MILLLNHPLISNLKGTMRKKRDVKIDKIGRIKGNIEKAESVMSILLDLQYFIFFRVLTLVF